MLFQSGQYQKVKDVFNNTKHRNPKEITSSYLMNQTSNFQLSPECDLISHEAPQTFYQNLFYFAKQNQGIKEYHEPGIFFLSVFPIESERCVDSETSLDSQVFISQYIINRLDIKFSNMIQTILLLIGLSVIVKPFANIIYSLWHHFRQLKLKPQYGEGWAVVTGATDGIGFGFCQELAQQGFNICLISRSQQKLAQKVKELQKQFGTKIQYKTIKADFKSSHEEGFLEEILKQLETLKIVLLINNVGYAKVGKFDEQSLSEVREVITVNCTPMAALSSYIVGRWSRQGTKGGIVNISSHSWVHAMPYLGSYAATKAFNDTISRQCSKEVAHRKLDNIHVLSVRAMMVSSGSVKRERSLLVPTSRECAHDSLKYLGYCEYTAGHIKHEVICHLTSLIPEFIMNKIIFSEATKVYEEFGAKGQ